MGSIGTPSNEDHKDYLVNSNFENLDEYDEQVLNDNTVEARSSSTKPFANGWDFPGIKDSIDEVQLRFENARALNTYERLIRRLNEIDNTISTSLNTLGPGEDKNALLTHRRRTRNLIRQIKNKAGLI